MLCYLRPAALFARRPARALSSRASTLTEQYDALVDRGELQYNPQQRELAIRLQQLRMELRKHSALTRGYASDLRVWHARVAEVMRLREEAAAREAARRAARQQREQRQRQRRKQCQQLRFEWKLRRTGIFFLVAGKGDGQRDTSKGDGQRDTSKGNYGRRLRSELKVVLLDRASGGSTDAPRPE